MFDEADAHNQTSLERTNDADRPVVSKTALRMLTWPAYAAIAVIMVFVGVALVVSALD